MPHAFRFCLLALVLTTACANLPEDASPNEDSLEEEDFPNLAATCRPNTWCNAQRAVEALPEITQERKGLPPDVRERYFATPSFEIATTPDGRARYQWFTGSAGRGAIYHIRSQDSYAQDMTYGGTAHIYGPIFEEWIRSDYERGLGYFTDPRGAGEQISQVFGIALEHMPSIANGGLLRSRHLLFVESNGNVLRAYRDEYLNSSQPGTPMFSPQPCTIHRVTGYYGWPLVYPEVSLEGYDGRRCGTDCTYLLWCGSTPPPEGDHFIPDV